MEIKYYNQPMDIKLGDILNERLGNGAFNEAWIISGFAKDSGFEELYDSIEKAVKSGTKINVIIGIDKKNISKDMLMKLLKNGCEIKIHTNDEEGKFETRMYAFEKNDGTSYVYLTASKLSAGGLFENRCVITEIKYADNEIKQFKNAIANVENGIDTSYFKELTEEYIIRLAENGDIVARIIDRKIPSISQMYKKNTVEIGIQEYDEGTSINNFNKEDFEDIDFDVELPISGQVEVKNSLGKEVEHVITKTKKQKKDNIEETEEVKKGQIIMNAGEPDYEDMTTFIMQLNKIVQKGVGEGEIKIPNSIAEHLYKFIDYPEMFHMKEDEKGKLKETAEIELDIIDNKSIAREIKDTNAVMFQAGRYLALKSDEIKNLKPEEKDIIRIIKKEKGKFKIEIIRMDTEEYLIWERFCTNVIKGSTRKFGTV